MIRSTSKIKEIYEKNGFFIFKGTKNIKNKIAVLGECFKRDFIARFNEDPESNRNVIKRFSGHPLVMKIFSSDEVMELVDAIGIAYPVYCGPVVTHYTSHDLTGGSYYLPYHQDWPSMGSSINSAILWFNIEPSGPSTHSIELVPGIHNQGLLEGCQTADGYILSQQLYLNSIIISAEVGDIVVMSSFIPHRTYLNPGNTGYKLSLSQRLDDLTCSDWKSRKYVNAYKLYVDRGLYETDDTSANNP